MKIISQTSWYDEPAEHTRRLVKSLAGFVDFAVFVDGRYKTFMPGAECASPMAQHIAIADACQEYLGDEKFDMHGSPMGPWNSQAGKRTNMWDYTVNSGWAPVERWVDYCLIIDADEELIVQDVDAVHERLRVERPDSVLVSVETPAPLGASKRLRGTHSWRNSTSMTGRGRERIFRALPEVWIDPKYHGRYIGYREDGQLLCLKERGNSSRHDGAQAPVVSDMTDLITIVNHTWSRDTGRLSAKHEHGVRREAEGVDL